MTAMLTSVPRVEEFVLSEGNGFISRDTGTVTLGAEPIKSGTVMGKVTASGKWVARDPAAADGSEVAKGLLYTGQPSGTGDAEAVLFVRDCEVVRAALTGLDASAETELAAEGIIVRGSYTTK